MLFNSYAFILVFLPATLSVFFLLSKYHKVKAASASIVIASLIFYGYWDVKYVPLLIASILFNYVIGKYIERINHKRLLVSFGISVNLILLGYYKYMNFVLETINSFLKTSFTITEIALPLGISFFTFTQIAYLIDAYRGETKKYSFLHYALFVTIFPHLIAGPVLYHKHIIPQFSKLRNYVFSYQNMAMGLALFSMGLFKKVVIADSLVKWVGPVFQMPSQATLLDGWAGALSFVFQIYFDFSGYSDMAIGLGLMLNIKLPVNFNSPYKATSIIQFWNRWHITMITFFNNYLYIPLRGRNRGYVFTLGITFFTMLVVGVWHGAGWTYIAWGGINGLYIVTNHLWRKFGVELPDWFSRIITFLAVIVLTVFFRAKTVAEALVILQVMLGLQGIGQSAAGIFKFSLLLPDRIEIMVVLTGLLLVVNFLPNSNQLLKKFKPTWLWAIFTVAILIISLLKLDNPGDFLYFQF